MLCQRPCIQSAFVSRPIRPNFFVLSFVNRLPIVRVRLGIFVLFCFVTVICPEDFTADVRLLVVFDHKLL